MSRSRIAFERQDAEEKWRTRDKCLHDELHFTSLHKFCRSNDKSALSASAIQYWPRKKCGTLQEESSSLKLYVFTSLRGKTINENLQQRQLGVASRCELPAFAEKQFVSCALHRR